MKSKYRAGSIGKQLLTLILSTIMMLTSTNPAFAAEMDVQENILTEETFAAEELTEAAEEPEEPVEELEASVEALVEELEASVEEPAEEPEEPVEEPAEESAEEPVEEPAEEPEEPAETAEETAEPSETGSSEEDVPVMEAEITFADSDEEVLSETDDPALVSEAVVRTGTDGLPVLNIILNGTTLDTIKSGYKSVKYEENTVELSEDETVSTYNDVTLKGHGNTTWTGAKRPFQIKFDKKQNLFGQGKVKKWILLANYFDYSAVRTDAGLKLARENGIPNALPQGQFVEVYFDGIYEGLYYLTRKVEVGTVDLEDEKGILVEIENLHDPDDLYVTSDNGTRVMIKETVIDSDDEAEQQVVLDNFMVSYNLFENAAKNRDWEKVKELVDIESFAKYFLLADFSSGQDMFGSSCFMHKDGDGDVIHAGPMWDFDLSYTNTRFRVSKGNQDPYRTWAYMDVREMSDSSGLQEWSPLYEYLMNIPEFREYVRTLYWSSVRETLTAIGDYAVEKEQSLDQAITADLQKWSPDKSGSESAKAVRAFMQARISYFDQLYAAPEELSGFYTMNGAYKNYIVRAEKNDDGYYTITNTDGYVLDVRGAGKDVNTVVRWYPTSNGTDAQRWLYLKNGIFVSKETGLFLTQDKTGNLTIQDASISNNTAAANQRFTLKRYNVDLSSCSILNTKAIVQNTKGLKTPSIKFKNLVLEQGKDYTLDTNISSSQAVYTMTGKNGFSGTVTVKTKIACDPNFAATDVYKIASALNGNKVLTVKGGSLSSKGNVQLETFDKLLENYWVFEKQSDETYVIRNVRSRKVLDVSGGSAANGANIQQYSSNGTLAQRFILDRYSNGTVEIINVKSGKAIDVAGGKTADGTNIRLYTANNTSAQRWNMVSCGSVFDGSGNYQIVSKAKNAGKVLAVKDASKNTSANVIIWSTAIKSDDWTLIKNSDGTYGIKNINSGKALDVKGAGKSAGTNVHQYTYGDGNTAQKWVIIKNKNENTYTLYSVCSGMALDVKGGSGSNGANVQIYWPNGTMAQKWVLRAA